MKFQFDQAVFKGQEKSRFKKTRTPGLSSRSIELACTLCLACLISLGCDRKARSDPDPAARGIAKSPAVNEAPQVETTLELSGLGPSCELRHRGLVLDLGDEAVASRNSFQLILEQPPQFATRLGESFRRLSELQTHYVIWLDQELKDFEFEARVHGLSSERMAVYIDDQRLGAASLRRDETHIIRISGKGRTFAAGRHRLTVSLSRPKSGIAEAEVSWIRLGAPLGPDADFPATRREVFSEVTIGKERHASIILRPGAALRCPLRLPLGGTLSSRVGLWGAGLAELEVIVHSPVEGRIVVTKVRREAADKRDFSNIGVDLSRFGGQRVDLELSAPHRSPGALVALASPKIVSLEPAPQHAPPARRAILILLSGLGEEHSPPQAGRNGLPFLNRLSQEGTSFPQYRGSTTSATAALASLLTGLAPYEHQVEGTRFSLPSQIPTIASAIEAQGGRAAFFTAVPTSFTPLGFDRGFGTFQETLPQADVSATEVVRLAQEWLGPRLEHLGPVFSIIQLRGAHPPFDISKELARELPPVEYGGELSPRRAALQLGDIRARRSEMHRRMPEEDWARLASMKKAALLRQSSALSAFLDWLRERSAYDDSLIIVMGDVAAGERPDIPYGDEAPLLEPYLAVPLIVKFPGGYARDTHVEGVFAPRDVSATVTASLGIANFDDLKGIDLGSSDATLRASTRPHVAYRAGAYSLRDGDVLLRGQDGKIPEICDPALDPGCTLNRESEDTGRARALWFSLYEQLAPALSHQQQGEELPANPDFDNALIVWGVQR